MEDEEKDLVFEDDYDLEDYDESMDDGDELYADWDEPEPIAKGEQRYVILIIYDITDNKKRNYMVKCLERYGVRVQKSAFEAFINKMLYEKMMAETSRIIDTTTDSLRIYQLDNYRAVRSWGLGDKHVDDVIIF